MTGIADLTDPQMQDREYVFVAASHGLVASAPMRCITLTVHSSLEAVGLTAAIATELARFGVSANVVAAYFHDHVFVPSAQAEQALAALGNRGEAGGAAWSCHMKSRGMVFSKVFVNTSASPS